MLNHAKACELVMNNVITSKRANTKPLKWVWCALFYLFWLKLWHMHFFTNAVRWCIFLISGVIQTLSQPRKKRKRKSGRRKRESDCRISKKEMHLLSEWSWKTKTRPATSQRGLTKRWEIVELQYSSYIFFKVDPLCDAGKQLPFWLFVSRLMRRLRRDWRWLKTIRRI